PQLSAEEDIPLSGRELQVLTLLAQGYSNKEIAEKLFLAVRTVETYKQRLMEKLRLESRAELVRYALQKGLLADV
ncbi:MAG: response regulator transcription factor, partial [Abditibacteriales bacterium]|nr:response regulator transcription factor [Abditibacteriales bacterium]MDW8368319.1 response regulator transcription factor [Abditibacteriales bacterium]